MSLLKATKDLEHQGWVTLTVDKHTLGSINKTKGCVEINRSMFISLLDSVCAHHVLCVFYSASV